MNSILKINSNKLSTEEIQELNHFIQESLFEEGFEFEEQKPSINKENNTSHKGGVIEWSEILLNIDLSAPIIIALAKIVDNCLTSYINKDRNIEVEIIKDGNSIKIISENNDITKNLEKIKNIMKDD